LTQIITAYLGYLFAPIEKRTFLDYTGLLRQNFI